MLSSSSRKFMLLCIVYVILVFVVEVNGWRSLARGGNTFRQKTGIDTYRSSMGLMMTVNVAGAIVRVQDLEKSKKFYSQTLQLPVSSKQSSSTAEVEVIPGLTLKLEQFKASSEFKEYKRGEGYDGIVMFTPQAKSIIEAQDIGRILRPFDTYKYQASLFPDEDEMVFTDTQHGILLDPDDFHVELHRNPAVTTPTARLRLNILEMKTSLEFYEGVLGMKTFRQRGNILNTPREASWTAYLGQTTETEGPVLDLVYQYGTETRVNRGNALEAVVLQSVDLEKTLKRITGCGVDYETVDGELRLTDPSGYQVRII